MRKMKVILIVALILQLKAVGQNFKLGDPLFSESGVRDYVTFNLTVSDTYQFSSDEQNNAYGTVTISVGKIKPSVTVPQGNGAVLFNWKLVSSPQEGGKDNYTWIGTSKNVKILSKNIYSITIPLSKLVGNAAGRLSKEDVIMIAQFSDPAGAPTGNEADNMVIARKNSSRNRTTVSDNR